MVVQSHDCTTRRIEWLDRPSLSWRRSLRTRSRWRSKSCPTAKSELRAEPPRRSWVPANHSHCAKTLAASTARIKEKTNANRHSAHPARGRGRRDVLRVCGSSPDERRRRVRQVRDANVRWQDILHLDLFPGLSEPNAEGFDNKPHASADA